MKYSITRIFLSSLILISCSNLYAQRVSNTAQITTHLLLEKNLVQAESLTYADFLGEGNVIQHTASFDILLSDDAAVRNILQLLQTPSAQPLNPKERNGRQLSFLKLSQLGETIEERQYLNTIVEDIGFTTLDAATRTAIKATIRIKATNVTVNKGGTRITASGRSKLLALASNFSISLGNLPVTRVTRISGLSIKPGNPVLTNFTIEVLATDATAWNQWFLTGGGGIKKEQGFIRILSPSMKETLFNLSLMDVEIISYSVTQGTQQAMSRAIIGLRLKGLAIK